MGGFGGKRPPEDCNRMPFGTIPISSHALRIIKGVWNLFAINVHSFERNGRLSIS